jgi:ribulose-phosphate 3-epimerase
MNMAPRICPSILNADHNHLQEEIAKVASADLLHLDVMDNIFVPNLTFSLEECREIIEFSSIPVDSHLMISDPDLRAVDYAEAGSASVTFHLEASLDPESTISKLRATGVRVGLAVKPGTPFSKVEGLLGSIDMLLIMTVEPGFGGQKFMTDQLPKIESARGAISKLSGQLPWLQVDGGISMETISLAARAGADTFVAGSAIYKAQSPAEMILNLRQAAVA